MEEDQQPSLEIDGGHIVTVLLTAAAVITTLMLLASASNAASRATASDPHKRGSWGIAELTWDRDRALNPHQRRWQTVLISGRDNDSRWSDLVAEIRALEHLANNDGVGPAPSDHDNKWLEASIANLEQSLSQTNPGDPAP